MGGCFRSTGLATVLSATSKCDLGFARVSTSDGSIIWAWSGGGLGDEKLMDIEVLPQGKEEVFFIIGGAASSAFSTLTTNLVR